MGQEKDDQSDRQNEDPTTFEESEESSGNIFYDLGLEDSTEKHVRVLMASAVIEILEKKGLLESQEQAAVALGAHQSQIFNLVGGAPVTSLWIS